MAQHKIEIDGDVFQFLKEKAEPFIDTPNTVLRRLLLEHSKAQTGQTLKVVKAEGTAIELPVGVPAALRETLEVAALAIRGGSRTGATHMVARKYNIAPQTVLDKYCRQLGLRANDFDRLLAQPGRAELIHRLTAKFPGFSGLIRKVLTG